MTENQREQIAQAGYCIEPQRSVEEKVSGSVSLTQRPGFQRLIDRMEQGDTLGVIKLDRIGRDSVDGQQTVRTALDCGIRLVVLQLGNLELTSSAGARMVKVLAVVADFERDLIIERTMAGLEGGKLGRPAMRLSGRLYAKRVKDGTTVSPGGEGPRHQSSHGNRAT